MAVKKLYGFKPSPNGKVMNSLRGYMSNDYQRRIPVVTQANIDSTIDALVNHVPTRNEFINALVNKVGLTIAKELSWSNPLSKFKRGLLEFGDTIEEINTGLLKAYTYDHDRESMEADIFGTERIEAQASYHKINRENYYKITINEMQLRRAFSQPMGLSSLISEIMQAPTTSDQWDEFLVMASLFRQNYDSNGFFKVNTPNIFNAASDSVDAKSFLRSVRTWSEKLTFIDRNYNAAHMPSVATPEDLELFITPEAKAALDVEALASAFNIDRADIHTRMTTVRNEDLNIPGAQAILTTKDFFVVADTLMTTTEQFNPANLSTNYFYHHHQIVSLSRFVPTILFTTEPGTEIIEITTPITGVAAVTMEDGEGTVLTEAERGTLIQMVSAATTDGDDAINTAVKWALDGNTSPKTRIYQTGVMLVAEDEEADTLTVTATSVHSPEFSASATVTITGDVITIWPVPEPEEEEPVTP